MDTLEYMINLIATARISHTRFDPRFGGRVLVYGVDPTSPTGVICIGACDEPTWIEAEKAAKVAGNYSSKLSPLSPTERY